MIEGMRAPPRETIRVTAQIVVILAGSWWLLGQLAFVMRPLLLAVFMGYVLMPWYSRLRRRGVPSGLVIAVLAGLAGLLLVGIFEMASLSAGELIRELPSLENRLATMTGDATAGVQAQLPWAPLPSGDQLQTAKGQAGEIAGKLAASMAGGLLEVATAALYLLFILLGAEKLPARVRKAYPGEQGDKILKIAGGINAAIIRYLRAKVVSSLLLAVAASIVLACFGVKLLAFWLLLTFLCNFIPYVGSVIGYSLPVAYAALQLPPWGEPIAVAILMLAVHVASATLVEPVLIGRSVGLSPLLILAALTVWGSIWGLPGMFLAVPLTVVVKIVLQNIEATAAFARLADE